MPLAVYVNGFLGCDTVIIYKKAISAGFAPEVEVTHFFEDTRVLGSESVHFDNSRPAKEVDTVNMYFGDVHTISSP